MCCEKEVFTSFFYFKSSPSLQDIIQINTNNMKKVILSMAVALACVTGASAQKQTGGEKNLEVQFAPLGGNPVSISGIRFRMFLDEGSAFRLGLFMGGTSSETITQLADSDLDDPELIDVEKTFDFSIRPGYEKHFAGTDRLSPYVGAEILFAISNTTTEEQYERTEDNEEVTTMITKGGNSTFGLNVVFGADYYFSDAIYLGAEFGFGYAGTKDKESETTYTNPSEEEASSSTLDNVKSSSWGPNYQGTIRLGWLFN
jgi:Putative OmpA-OmpF-like porin family